jgi:hypothetical protein
MAQVRSKDTEARYFGWGVDLPREERPGVPRESVLPADVGLRWREDQIPRQRPSVPIFLSVERKSMTPIQGTSCPPRGLSGALRTFAYRFGEARLARWMTLLFADRVDVVEGYLEDARRGRGPERARAAVVLASGAAASFGAIWLVRRARSRVR